MTATPPLPPAPLVPLPSDRAIPQIGLGTLAVQPDRTASDENAEITCAVVAAALEVGYRHVDTAQSYGSERGVGRAIAGSGLAREDLFLTSKLANGNHDPAEVERTFEQTLTHLGTDHLDLFLIHWPLPTLDGGDYVSTWKAVVGLQEDGRLRSAGVSNFQPEHLDRIIAETGAVPVVDQVESHPYFANTPVREACARHGIVLEAHSPLGHNRAPSGCGRTSTCSASRSRKRRWRGWTRWTAGPTGGSDRTRTPTRAEPTR